METLAARPSIAIRRASGRVPPLRHLEEYITSLNFSACVGSHFLEVPNTKNFVTWAEGAGPRCIYFTSIQSGNRLG